MSQSYQPIPIGGSLSDTQTATIARGCYSGTRSSTGTASVSVDPSGFEEYTPISVHKIREVPTDGQWSQIRKSGLIKMTPMRIINRRETNYLASFNLNATNVKLVLRAEPDSLSAGSCVLCANPNGIVYKDAVASVDYDHQGDFNYWRSLYPSAPYLKIGANFSDSEIEAAKSAAFSELFQAYNLGEELYELRETIALLRSLLLDGAKIISKFKRQFDKDPAAGQKALADIWMTFRYGIMPIIYSIQDIQDLIKSKGRFRTIRKTVTPEDDRSVSLPTSGCYFYDTGVDSSIIRITAKGAWATELSRISDTVNINPFTTAAAVYPWALVVRWFFNINTWIDAQLKSSTTSALQHVGCVAVKTTYDIKTYFHMEHDSRIISYFDGTSGSCGNQFYVPHGPNEYGRLVSQTQLVRESTEDSYERYLYSPTDTKLVYNPHITWQRIVDGLIMGSRPVSKLLRSIK